MGSVDDAYANLRFCHNAMAKSFFATLEGELIGRRVWKTQTEARLAVFTWIESWYNPKRLHSALGYMSPINFERKHKAQKQQTPPSTPEDALPTARFAPVDKTPQGLSRSPSPCQRQAPWISLHRS